MAPVTGERRPCMLSRQPRRVGKGAFFAPCPRGGSAVGTLRFAHPTSDQGIAALVTVDRWTCVLLKQSRREIACLDFVGPT
jgi:hypothetical protein